MKLTIHIGTRKTGTTSIQEFLRKNKAILALSGTHILDYSSMNQYEFALATDISHNLKYYIEKLKREAGYNFHKYSKAFFDNLKREICSLPSTIDHVVISSEDCSLLDKASIDYLKKQLSSIFHEIKVIAYFRRQDKYASSNVTTALRSGYNVNLDYIFNPDDVEHLYYNKIMSNWSSIFGFDNIKCRVFEKDKLFENDLVKDFVYYSEIEASKDLDFSKISSNESIDVVTAKCIEIYNSSEILSNENEHARDQIIKLIRDEGIEKFLPERSKAIEFQSMFTEENRNFQKNFFRLEDELFSSNFDEYPENSYDKDFVYRKSLESLLKIIVDREKELVEIESTIKELNSNVQFLNNLAKKYEKQNDTKTALSLLKICKKIRPNGEFINSKIKELEGI